ncbi:MAG: long-chain fatty acid--CoA ligase [Bacteroidota bacterium]
MLNLANILENSAAHHGDKAAFVFGDTRHSFTQLNTFANYIANGLRAAGIQAGDKVALSCPNLPYFPMIYYGILKAGAVVVPLSILLKREEIKYHLQDSEAKAYFCFEGTARLPMRQEGYAAFQQVEACEKFYLIMPSMAAPSSVEGVETLASLLHNQEATFPTAATAADDTAVIIYTSGTTGQPKGAELTHANLLKNATISQGILELREDDTSLIVLPLFHIFAMTVLMNANVANGSTSVLLASFDQAAVFNAFAREKVSVFAGVPTMYWALLNYDGEVEDFAAICEQLRVCVSGGASLPVQVLEDFEAKFSVKILEGYGMSEGSPVVTFNHPGRERVAGSIGTPVEGVEVMLVDQDDKEVPIGEKGELIYRGHNVMKGYYRKPEATAEALRNGWMHSGDVAVKDEAGYFYIVDRKKDMIIRGGLNVYPREVEEVMMKHPAVSLVAVIGVPNEQYGEEIRACVVLKEGHTVEEAELVAWTKENIAAYKYPRLVSILPALPMNSTGKVMKRELRQQFQA